MRDWTPGRRVGSADRSGIGAVRLEQLFDTLRSEVTTTAQPPQLQQVVRSAAGRRRRRRGTALGVGCALVAAAVWGVPQVAPLQMRGPAGAPEADQTVRAEVPLPGPPASGSGVPTAVPSSSVDAVGEQSDGRLLLSGAELPTVAGVYGPWDELGDGQSSVDPAAMCLTRAVGLVGAASVERRTFADRVGRSVLAAQYLLVFGSVESAERAAAQLLDPVHCAVTVRDWATPSCEPEVLVARDGTGREEITVQRAGARVVAMAVHQGVVSEQPEVDSVHSEFEAAAVELDTRAELFASEPDRPAAATRVPAVSESGSARSGSAAPSASSSPVPSRSAASSVAPRPVDAGAGPSCRQAESDPPSP